MYKLNIVIIFCLCIAAIFANAAPLNITPQNPSSSLTARSAMPLNLNADASANYQAKKRRGLVKALDLSESEMDNRPLIVNNRMIKRDPINYTVDFHQKDPVVHTKRVQKRSRMSIVKQIGKEVLFKRNEKERVQKRRLSIVRKIGGDILFKRNEE